MGFILDVILEAKVTPKGTCGSLWGSSEGKWGSLLAGWVAAGLPAARLAGLAGPGLRQPAPVVVKLWFLGVHNNQQLMEADYKLPNCKTTGLQATKLQDCKDCHTANCKAMPPSLVAPKGAGGYIYIYI